MKKEKMIGLLLLAFAVFTIIGMLVENAAFWRIYNYITVAFSVVSGVVLLREK